MRTKRPGRWVAVNPKRLLMARELAGLTVAELCEPVGFDPGAYVLLEQGRFPMEKLPDNFTDVLDRLPVMPRFFELDDPPEIGWTSLDIHFPGWRKDSERALKGEYAQYRARARRWL